MSAHVRHFCFCFALLFTSHILILQGILINGQFPGPDIFSVTNDNIIINVQNDLPEPFLLSW